MFYHYKCTECGRITELRIRPVDIPQSFLCPYCHCGNAKRLFGGHQINMKIGTMQHINYDRLPENLKTGDTTFLKNPQYSR